MYTASLYGALASVIASAPEGIEVSLKLFMSHMSADISDRQEDRHVRFRFRLCCLILRYQGQRVNQKDRRDNEAEGEIG